MAPLEFDTELSGDPILTLPPDILQQLPASGHAKVVVFVQNSEDPEDREWLRSAYEQFAAGSTPEDEVYDQFE